jgi:hypothetical protein
MRYRFMATYRGVPYEAGVGPTDSDIVLFAACPPPEGLGFQPATGHWRKAVTRAEVDAIWESRPSGIFGGEPCLVLDELGDQLHIGYPGHDPIQAERLGYCEVEPGVFEVLVNRDDVGGISEERVDRPYPAATSWPATQVPPWTPAAAASASASASADPGLPSAGSGSVPAGPPWAASVPGGPGWSGSGSIEPPWAGTGETAWPGPGPETGAGRGSGSGESAQSSAGGPTWPANGRSQWPGSSSVAPPWASSGSNRSTRSDSADPAWPAPVAMAPVSSALPPLPAATPPVAAAVPAAGPTASAYPAPTFAAPVGLAPTPAADPAAVPGPFPTAGPVPATGLMPPAVPLPPLSPLPGGAGLVPPARTGDPAQAQSRRRRHAPDTGPSWAGTRQTFTELANLAAITPGAYSIDNQVDGAICLIRTDKGFEVFTSVDGTRQETRLFADEEAAYFYLFGLLAAEAVRDGRLLPPR